MTHGLASYHFGTRESMIHETLKWAVENTIEAAHLAAPVDGIEEFAADVPRTLSERPEDAVFQFDLLLRALRSPELMADVRKSYDDYVNAIEETLSGCGIEGKAVARLVFAALDGLTLQQLLYDDRHRTEEAIAVLRHLLSLLARSMDGTLAPHRDGAPPATDEEPGAERRTDRQ